MVNFDSILDFIAGNSKIGLLSYAERLRRQPSHNLLTSGLYLFYSDYFFTITLYDILGLQEEEESI